MGTAVLPVSVLIVDDSASMCAVLRHILERDSRLTVVGEAYNAEQAEGMIKVLKPDVMTLDVNMPGTCGLDFLKRLMREAPMPVVMCSAMTGVGTRETRRAISAGAVGVIKKPKYAEMLDTSAICNKVLEAASVPVARRILVDRRKTVRKDQRIFLIGASTGGVGALEELLPQLPDDCPPVVIAQHMPMQFLDSLRSRLDGDLPHDVDLVSDGEVLEMGQIRFAPSGRLQTRVSRKGTLWSTHMVETDEKYLYKPSVDHLFLSAVQFAKDVVSTILTGLGNDGAKGMVALRAAGAHTFGQTEATCTVYGMPKAAKEAGGVQNEADAAGLATLMMKPARRGNEVHVNDY